MEIREEMTSAEFNRICQSHMRELEQEALDNDIPLLPLGDRLLIVPTEDPSFTRGGIAIPDTARPRPRRGTVIAKGPGKYDKTGVFVPTQVQIGQEVLWGRHSGADITVGDRELFIICEQDLFGYVPRKPA